ncbi:hypothetical protein M3J09_000550 [Ascochyta lentis]
MTMLCGSPDKTLQSMSSSRGALSSSRSFSSTAADRASSNGPNQFVRCDDVLDTNIDLLGIRMSDEVCAFRS